MSPGQGFVQVLNHIIHRKVIYEQKQINKKWQKCQGNGQKGINLRIMCQKTNKKNKNKGLSKNWSF